MIYKLIRAMLRLDQNDRQIEVIQARAMQRINEATVVLQVAGEMQQKLVKRTTTYYIARAVGAIT